MSRTESTLVCSVCGSPAGKTPDLSPETGAPVCKNCSSRATVDAGDKVRARGERLAMLDEEYRLKNQRDARCTTARRCAACGASEVWVQQMTPEVSYFWNAVAPRVMGLRWYAGRTYHHACLKCGKSFVTDSVGLVINRSVVGLAMLCGGAVLAIGAIRMERTLFSVVGLALVLLGFGELFSVLHRLLLLRKNPPV
jgi:DNA-directed RNA polymerase subunit RPC12/RpoP